MKIKHLAIILLSLAGASCSNNEDFGEHHSINEFLSEGESRAAWKSSGFDSKFFIEACRQSEGNIVVSPVSAKIMLTMFSNAVSEETEKEIARVIGYDDKASLNSLCTKYLTNLPLLDNQISLTFANSFWYKESRQIHPDFAPTAEMYFGESVFPHAFSPVGQLLGDMNKWVATNTLNMIPAMLTEDDLSEAANYVLLNALSFSGKWQDKFDKKETKDGVFHGKSGDRKVKMMRQKIVHPELHYTDHTTSVVLFLGNGSFEVAFVLPDEGVDIDELIESGEIVSYKDNWASAQLDLTLPRFSYSADDNTGLVDILAGMGCESLRTPDAVKILEGQTDNQAIYLLQKCAVEFDEDGAKAVASSGGSDGLTAAITPGSTHKMVFDRPFVFFISERSTDAIILAGKIVDL